MGTGEMIEFTGQEEPGSSQAYRHMAILRSMRRLSRDPDGMLARDHRLGRRIVSPYPVSVWVDGKINSQINYFMDLDRERKALPSMATTSR